MVKGENMNEEILMWIKELIRENDVHRFYASGMWRRKQAQILKEKHWECERCKKKGKVKRADTVHHIKYLRDRPDLALEDENLEVLCKECHYDEHHKKKGGFVNEERW